jgi:hypothetical protein
MEDIMWKVAHTSLGHALNDIASAPEVAASPGLRKRVTDAREFHNELGSLSDELVIALQTNRQILDDLTRDADTIPVGRRSYAKYRTMADSGEDPMSVCKAAIDDGLGTIGAVAALRSAFNMLLGDALRVKETLDSDTQPDSAR